MANKSQQSDFGKRLVNLMVERRLTIKDAANAAKISTSTLHNWRIGHNPVDFLAVRRLAEVLKVSFSFLLTGVDDSRQNNAVPAIAEVFKDGGQIFDGYAKITIQRLIPNESPRSSGSHQNGKKAQ